MLKWTRFQKKIDGASDELALKSEDQALLISALKQAGGLSINYKFLVEAIAPSCGEMKVATARMRWTRLSKKLGMKGVSKVKAAKVKAAKGGEGDGEKVAGKGVGKGRKKLRAGVESGENSEVTKKSDGAVKGKAGGRGRKNVVKAKVEGIESVEGVEDVEGDISEHTDVVTNAYDEDGELEMEVESIDE